LGPYFITAALRTSSSVFFHTPPLMKTRGMLPGRARRDEETRRERERDEETKREEEK
jgi:hypothetical protein